MYRELISQQAVTARVINGALVALLGVSLALFAAWQASQVIGSALEQLQAAFALVGN